MAKFTTQVRTIVESQAGLLESGGFNNMDETIAKAAPKIFNFNFPIFDETYRLPLEIKILRHYYTREICEETVGLWKIRLDARLNEIMPYYNKLYESELITFNPLYDVDLTRTHDRTNNTTKDDTGNSKTDTTFNRKFNSKETESGTDNNTTSISGTSGGTTTSNTNNVTTVIDTTTNKTTDKQTTANADAFSETPQGGINGVVNLDYLTNYRKVDGTVSDTGTADGTKNSDTTATIDSTITANDKNDSKSTSTGDNSRNSSKDDTTADTGSETTTNSLNSKVLNTEDYLEKVTGKQGTGSYSSMLMEYRETFLNIDKMVIEELGDLFFTLW